MRITTAIAAVAAAAAQGSGSGQQIWSQTVAAAVYTSAGVSRHGSGQPTFSVATWLNAPIEVVGFSPASNTSSLWTFQSANTQATFHVDMARHSEVLGTSVVDTVVQETFTGSDGFPACAIYGLISNGAGATGVPVWNVTVNQCNTYTLDDSVIQVDISDDGSTVAWCGAANETVGGKVYMTPRAWGLDAQTGKVLFMKDLGINQAPAVSSVSLSSTGAFLAYTYGTSVFVMDGRTGVTRANITQLDPSVPAAISDDGTYVVSGAPATMDVWAWTPSTHSYTMIHSLTPPSSETWYPTDFDFSDNVAGAPGSTAGDRSIAAVAWMDSTAMQIRSTMFNVSSGALLADYTSAKNAQYQNQAIVRLDGDLCAIASWGDRADIPTVIVLQAGSNTPVYTAITPGSMFGVDITVTSANDKGTTAYVVAAGKSVPANMFGNGGNAYAWQVLAPNV